MNPGASVTLAISEADTNSNMENLQNISSTRDQSSLTFSKFLVYPLDSDPGDNDDQQMENRFF
jgi:hypothetical protein